VLVSAVGSAVAQRLAGRPDEEAEPERPPLAMAAADVVAPVHVEQRAA
jgi:hypothetical protein